MIHIGGTGPLGHRVLLLVEWVMQLKHEDATVSAIPVNNKNCAEIKVRQVKLCFAKYL